MNESDLLAIINKLNNISFHNMEKLSIGDALFYQLKYYTKKSFINILKAAVAPIFKYTYNIENRTEAPIVFFYGSSYYKRNDYKDKIKKVEGLLRNPASVVCGKRIKISIKSFADIWRVIIYYRSLKHLNMPKNLRIFIACSLLGLYFEMNQIIKLINGTSPKLVVTFCDCMPIDSVITQYYNLQGIKTATLQHGHFDNKDLNGRYAFLMSKSDYFLCYGEYTKRIALKLGVNEDKIIIAGPPELINKELPNKLEKNSMKKFGVLLSFIDRDKENKFLLETAKRLAEEFGLSYEVRPHPSLDMKSYADLIDNKYCIGLDSSNETIDDFYGRQDFIILGGTSVFISLVSKLKIVFRYVEDDRTDIFAEIDCGKFSSLDGLLSLYKEVSANPDNFEKKLLETRKTLISDNSISENYINFFNRFIS